MSVKIVKVDGDYKIQVAEGGDITFDAGPTGNVSISGNLSISGTTTYIQTTQLQIEDNIITLNRGELGNGVSEDTAGINIERGTNNRGNAQIIWDENAQWQDPVSGSLQDGLFIFKTTIGGTNGIRTNSIDSHNSDLWFSTGDDGILVVKSNGNYAGLIDTYGNPNSIPNKQWVEDFVQYNGGGGGGATTLNGLVDVVITGTPSNGQVLKYDTGTSKWINGTDNTGGGGGGASVLDDLTDVVISGTPSDGQVLKYDAGTSKWINGTDNTGGGGGGSSSRTTASATTSSIANDASANLTISGFKGYALYKIQTSAAAWVTIYTSTAARTADALRTITTDPAPGAGILAEAITISAQTQVFTPAVFGFSDESSPSTNIQLKVVNRSGSTAAITITLTLLQLEV